MSAESRSRWLAAVKGLRTFVGAHATLVQGDVRLPVTVVEVELRLAVGDERTLLRLEALSGEEYQLMVAADGTTVLWIRPEEQDWPNAPTVLEWPQNERLRQDQIAPRRSRRSPLAA